MRGDTGVKSIDGLTSGSTGEELRALCDTLLGGAGIQTLSFRMNDGASCVKERVVLAMDFFVCFLCFWVLKTDNLII